MLNCDKIHPQLAFQHSGLFIDSESAYTMSKEYYDQLQEQRKAEQQEIANQQTGIDNQMPNNDD